MAGSHRFRVPFLLVGLVLAVSLLLGAGSARAAVKVCPDTFQVLHNDYVGKLSLPKGHYRITLLKPQKPLTCQDAALLFRKFLEDYDGKLQGRWRVVPRSATFLRGGSGVGFRVRRRGKPSGSGGGKHPAHGGRRCPDTFTVENNDRIGKLKLKAGKYNYTRLTDSSPSCTRIPTLLAKFLEDFDGDLPRGWRLSVRRAAFLKKGTSGDGFSVKPVR